MNKNLLIKALVSSACIFVLTSYECKADDQLTNLPGSYSAVSPIYPTPDQQIGSMWGATELMRCPDGFKLVFENQSPVCVSMISQSGGPQ